MKLTNMYVWRNVCSAYLPLESFLSTQVISDDCLICVDPQYDLDMQLAYRLAAKLDKVRVIEFRWPENAPGDGSRIGIASQYALDQVGADTDYVLNVQADEIYSPKLTGYLKSLWSYYANIGLDCLTFKVLNLEHNMQQYQGGDEKSTWDWQVGAGYNKAVKLFRRCSGITFARDGWTMEGCAVESFSAVSQKNPIVHAHDNFRDTLIELRRRAATEIWTDPVGYGHYKASADTVGETRAQWWDDPKWTNPVPKFPELLPDYVLPLVGQTHYTVRWELIDAL
jgi:hypothetical protein